MNILYSDSGAVGYERALTERDLAEFELAMLVREIETRLVGLVQEVLIRRLAEGFEIQTKTVRSGTGWALTLMTNNFISLALLQDDYPGIQVRVWLDTIAAELRLRAASPSGQPVRKPHGSEVIIVGS